MDVWSWICELPNSDEWAESGSPLVFHLTNPLDNNSVKQAIQLKAERTLGSISDASLTFSVWFHSSDEEKRLWTSDEFPLSSEKPFLPLIFQILQEIIRRAPTAQDIIATTCPRSQLQKLKPEPVSWILDSHSPESLSVFFNLIFLTQLFWICVFDAPSEIGSLYFHSLLAPNLHCFSSKEAPVLRSFFTSVGTDVELCFVRTLGYMLTKLFILRETMSVGLQSLAPFPSQTLGFSYALESHGFWILKGYAPVKTMKLTLFDDQKIQRPVVEANESVLRYALAHQQLEGVVQLEYTVGFQDGYIQVNARVNNIRFHVAKLGFGRNEDNTYVDERHFPSRIRIWVGPEVGATYVAGLTLGRSTDNVEREIEMQRIMRGSFGKSKVPKVKTTARMATRTRMKNWRWDQDVQGDAAIFDAVLSDNTSGLELGPWRTKNDGDQLGNTFRGRYMGPNRPFTKSGGVVFAGEECGGGVGWRLRKEMEGSMLKWRIGAQIWLSYLPNHVKSSYFETRCVEWCDEVDLPLIPGKY